jgi:hypothetical protein
MALFNMDVDPDEYVTSCSKYEINELIKALIEEGYLPEGISPGKPDETCVTDLEWEISCAKLLRNKHLLSSQDEMTILEICNKLI